MKLCNWLAASVLMSAGTAWSETSQNEITYQDALAKCQDFVNDPQLVQIKFKVSCYDESYDWQETSRRTLEVLNQGEIGYQILMKEKWHTPNFAIPMARDSVKSECPVLSRFVSSRQSSLVMSCAEFVNNFPNPEDIANKCAESLADVAPQREPTGEEVDLCAGSSF